MREVTWRVQQRCGIVLVVCVFSCKSVFAAAECAVLSRDGRFCACEIANAVDFDQYAFSVSQDQSSKKIVRSLLPRRGGNATLAGPVFLDEGAGALVGRHFEILPYCARELAAENPTDYYSQLIEEGDRGKKYFLLVDPEELKVLRGDPAFDAFALFALVSYFMDSLEMVFHAGQLVYRPESMFERESVRSWPAGLRVELGSAPAQYECYSRGTVHGVLRPLTEAQWCEARAAGDISRQDVLVLDGLPMDFDVPAAGVITTSPQGFLSHINILCLREGVPNAYIAGAFEKFGQYAGAAVRFEVAANTFRLEPSDLSAVTRDLQARRPRTLTIPQPDDTYEGLPTLEELSLAWGAARVGGKAAYLGCFRPTIPSEMRVRGFAIPFHYFMEFLQANTGAGQSFAELYVAMRNDGRFAQDPAFRRDRLAGFRDILLSRGRVPRELVVRLADKIREVFGGLDVKVRFRSSSNVEDSLFFPGAGLYDSKSVCAADSFDRDSDGPCLCDQLDPQERIIEWALLEVWASVWNFRAVEDRLWYGIDEENVRMGILVTPAFTDEAANGVALTGDPFDPNYGWYYVTSQLGDVSVVAPPVGIAPEIDVLGWRDDGGCLPTHVRRSSLALPGQWVLGEEQLRLLGGALSAMDRAWARPAGLPPELVRLDVEFKLGQDGGLRIKQVRPYLLPRAEFFTRERWVSAACEAPYLIAVPEENGDVFAQHSGKLIVLPWSGNLLVSARPGTGEASWVRRIDTARGSYIPSNAGSADTMVDVSGWVEGRIEPAWTFRQVLWSGADMVTLETKVTASLPVDIQAQTPSEVTFVPTTVSVTRGDRAWNARLYSPTLGQYPLYRVDIAAANQCTLRLYERRIAGIPAVTLLVYAEVEFPGLPRVVVDAPLALACTKGVPPQRKASLIVLPNECAPAHAILVEFLLGETAPYVCVLDNGFGTLSRSTASDWHEELSSVSMTTRFRRGDANADGVITIADAIALLGFLFSREGPVRCSDAADANDDGILSISDAVAILRRYFAGHGNEALCAADETPDSLLPCDYGVWLCQ